MLILTRKPNEPIDVFLPDGRVITVVVTEIRHGSRAVRVGIDAPGDVTILRRELVAEGGDR